MQALIFRFFDICLLRAGPQDIPASRFLLRVAIALNLVLGTALYLPAKGFEQSLTEVLLDFVLLVSLLYLALRWRGQLPRFQQALTALMGTGVVLIVVAMPFVYRLIAAEVSGESALVALQFYLLIIAWNIAVFAHIMRHTFDIHIGYGLLISVGYLVLFWSLSDLLFGVGS